MTSDSRAENPAPLDLEELLRMLPFLEPAELMAISAAYQHADPAPRDAARKSASTAVRSRHRTDDLDRLQGSIIQWAGADLSPTSAFTLECVSHGESDA